MTNISIPDMQKLKQFIIQFAFRVPIRKELTGGEKKALENVLKNLDAEHFQLFEETASKSPATLFQVIHQLPIGPGTIMVPSFTFLNGSFSFIWPVYMFDQYASDFNSLDTSDMNKKMSGWIVTVQNVIGNSNCHRTGKIYEIVLGPFSQAEKVDVFQKLFSINLDDVGEVNLTFAKYIKSGNSTYNIQTNINYMQRTLEDNFDIRMRVDINNRKLETFMEPNSMGKIWNFADDTMGSYFEELLKI
ncbi:hypothetical protein HQ584_05245 [Patescibacteria group bacterium]|nr:hypothetical protein [Patescibacteria group bacterium]